MNNVERSGTKIIKIWVTRDLDRCPKLLESLFVWWCEDGAAQFNVALCFWQLYAELYEYKINNLKRRKSERSLMEIVYDVCCWDRDEEKTITLLAGNRRSMIGWL